MHASGTASNGIILVPSIMIIPKEFEEFLDEMEEMKWIQTRKHKK